MNRDFLIEYSVQGRRMIQLGLFFVFAWAAFYMIAALTLPTFRLSATIPFLVFGILCAFLGLLQKKKAKKAAKNRLTGIDEISLSVLALEMLGAAILLFYAIGKGASSFIVADLFSLVLSLVSFYSYVIFRKGVKNALVRHRKSILLLALMSHLLWSSLISALV